MAQTQGLNALFEGLAKDAMVEIGKIKLKIKVRCDDGEYVVLNGNKAWCNIKTFYILSGPNC